MSSSSFNDAFIHTPRYFTWFTNCTCTPFRKTFDGAGCLYFFGQKRTPIVLLQLKMISCSAAQSSQIFRRHCSPLILGLNTHISSANFRWFTTIIVCCYDNISVVKEIIWSFMVWQTSCWNRFDVVLKVTMIVFICGMLNKSWILLQTSNCKRATALSALVIVIIVYFSVTLRDARSAGALLPLFFQQGGNGGGANFSSQYHREFHG